MYGVAKSAVCGLTRSDDPARQQAMVDRTRIGHNATPEDCAGAAVLLAGEAATCVTGQMVFVDGGFSVT